MVVDAICNQLFESNWDIYAEDELSLDGEMIYSPPSLDDVWLSEPEHQERSEKMQVKHCWHEECQCIQAFTVHGTSKAKAGQRIRP